MTKIILIVLCLVATCTSVQAGNCLSHLTAPSTSLPNRPPVWNKTDSGPILEAFLNLSDYRGGLQEIANGVDLSHYQTTMDYAELKRCGTTFAIVKMDVGFENHSKRLDAQGIKILPYHYLGAAGLTSPSTYSNGSGDLSPEQFDALMDRSGWLGTDQAITFLGEYKRRVDLPHQNFDYFGMKGRIIVIDVEEHFVPKSTKLQRVNFGRVYAHMLANWIGRIHVDFPDAIIVFYTFPDIYTSYLQFALAEDHAVIHGMPIWLARTKKDGSDFDLINDKDLQRICLSTSGGNRCLLHQYSHRAIFAINKPPSWKSSIPPHFDADRMFHVVELHDGVGVQYVRAPPAK